ncbi:MAG: peroxiredoxin family protein [Verrucomicrobiales bacterium]
MKIFHATILALSSAGALSTAAEETSSDPAEGHSYHGEVFNEGPRQAAVLIPGTGDVHFPVTTDSAEAQAFFDQGLGQLHGFWDFEAERSFRHAATLEPDCAMAYWGMAMANFKNDKRGKKFAEEAVARQDGASEAERMWIDGIADYYKDTKRDSKKRLRDFVRSLEKIATKHPDDLEAKAFLLKQIYQNHGKGLPIQSHYTVDLLAEEILTRAPSHPANHYRIHLWDREDPARALTAAAACGPAAPGIAHMWHMPGHIYSRLHRYADAAWQQEASARVDHAHMIRFRIVPDQIHNFAHNNEWLIRNFNFLGRRDRSVELAANMISLPRLAKFKNGDDDDATYQSKGSSWHYGRQRLRDTLFQFSQWDELIREAEDGRLQPDDQSITSLEHDRFVGIAKFESGDHDGGRIHLDALTVRLGKKKTQRDKAVAAAETKARKSGKEDEDVDEAGHAAGRKFKKDLDPLQQAVDELSVYAALTDAPPDLDTALSLLPGLENVPKWRHATLWLRADDPEEAERLARDAVAAGKNEVLPLATQIRILHANGKSEEAEKAFGRLRSLAHAADPDLAAFEPLAAVAAEFGYPADWRTPPGKPASDLGERPPLDSLGPFRWSPPEAPDFSLRDADGEPTALSDRRGRPVLVVFYLGRGCPHCMEQLDAFAPLHEKYADAGIDIVAVSTDSVEGLKQTFRGTEAGENPFPFALLSDESLSAFKDYRAYDDFEEMPLHGTFLVDGSGHIRWQDIGFEPFMHPEWLLEESIRLLTLTEPES